MRVIVDEDRCIGSGRCVLAVAAVFDQRDDTGMVRLLDDTPSAASHDLVRQAAVLCPALAITVVES